MNVKIDNIKKLDVSKPLKLDCGKTISNFPLAYETYGKLNNNKKRKNFKKIVHSDAPNLEAPDPRWAGELSKLKDLLANQKTPA